MLLYFAGAESFPKLLYEAGAQRWLISYPNKKILEWKDKIDIFIDSGAFSVFTGVKKINHADYIKFLLENKMKTYASLDVIGNSEATKKNFKIEVEAGLDPIPTFHYAETFSCLEWYANRCEYLALGGVAQLGSNIELRRFLNRCFKILMPLIISKKLKVHGFGISSVEILKNYPFYSCDSTSWLKGARFGAVDKWNPQKLKISSSSYRKPETYLKLGHSLKITKGYKERLRYSLKEYKKMEIFITKLWKQRGINYD